MRSAGVGMDQCGRPVRCFEDAFDAARCILPLICVFAAASAKAPQDRKEAHPCKEAHPRNRAELALAKPDPSRNAGVFKIA